MVPSRAEATRQTLDGMVRLPPAATFGRAALWAEVRQRMMKPSVRIFASLKFSALRLSIALRFSVRRTTEISPLLAYEAVR